jgi:two-component system, sensor histidine kinase RegB
MTQQGPDARIRYHRTDWLPLRTLILLRWMAIAGQSSALIVAQVYLGFELPIAPCLAIIATAILANLVSINRFPRNKRLSVTQSMALLLFDTLQLTLLLYFTGGLTNPFSLLLLAPVVVSASALDLRATLIIGSVAAICTSVIALFRMPLHTVSGQVFDIPKLFEFGFWLAILVGIAFLGLYARRISTEIHAMSDALLATQLALAREQKLTDLGGVVAAAAHELGTPLATIKLVSAELMDELRDHPTWREDATLIRDQADRCRDILRQMGKAGNDDLHLRRAPFSATIHEAAEPHAQRGKALIFCFDNLPQEPTILRRPELIHGVRNLVQNAVDFARNTVWIDGTWTEDHLILRISDDGAGFAPQILGRIGDPFLRMKRDFAPAPTRPGYEGMGMGLFIAKTLLERTGATLRFANGSSPFLNADERPTRCGAIVEVVWPLALMRAERGIALGQNMPMA